MKDPCSSVAPLLDKYFDGEASAEEKETIERHLTDCGPARGSGIDGAPERSDSDSC